MSSNIYLEIRMPTNSQDPAKEEQCGVSPEDDRLMDQRWSLETNTFVVGIRLMTQLALQLSGKRKTLSTNAQSIDQPYEKYLTTYFNLTEEKYFQVY